MNFVKLGTHFLQNTSGQLLLNSHAAKEKKSNKVDANPGTSRKRNYIEDDSIIKDIDGVNASKNQSFKVICHQDATIFFK